MFWPIFIAACSFWGIALGGALYFGRRYVRALERIAESNERLAELQQHVEALKRAAEELPRMVTSERPMLAPQELHKG